MKTSLSAKMLLLTLGSFLLLIFGITASLYLYFNRFYEPEKINQMINSINKFTAELENSQWSDEELYSEVSKFMKNQNATMSIQSQLSLVMAAPAKAVLTNSIPDYVVLSKEPVRADSFSSLDLTSYAPLTTGPSLDTVAAANINGSLVLYPTALTAATVASPLDINKKKGVTYTISTIPYTNYRQVNFIKKSTLKSGEVKITSVNLSLQSVNEVTSFLIRFFPFLISASILLSFIMVVVYSKTISKPIISITKTANRMANMELGISSDIKRSDELGALSSSLNTLSVNLKNALDDLSFANTKLTADYEKELCQDKARKEFVANVSHELKTPLGIIRSYTEGIRDGVRAEKKEHYMEVILNEITHMDQMILEMLEISRYDAGAVTYTKKASDISLYLEKSMQIFSEKAYEKGVDIQILGEFGTVIMDEKKIERAVNNLMENAVKYCSSNSTIQVFGERNGKEQRVLIENCCPALSEEAISKIWDRFYKADASHNRETEGTGLGLAIVKSIFEGHECSYEVYNTESGICFSFTLETV